MCDVEIDRRRLVVPGRILEHDVPIERDGERIRRGAGHRLPSQLAAGRQRPVDRLFRAAVHRCGVDGSHRLDLRLRQAVGAVTALAEQDRRIESAARRILDQAVGGAVLRVAGIQRRAMDHRILRRRHVAGRRLVRGLVDPHLVDAVSRAVVGEADGGRDVQILGVPLHHRDGVARSAAAAFVHVGERRRAVVVGAHDRFRAGNRRVQGRIGQVGELFRVLDGEARAGGAGDPEVRAGGDDPGAQQHGHPCIGNRTAPEAVARRLEVAGPTLRRQPDLHRDLVRHRPHRRHHTAEGRQVLDRLGVLGWRREGAARHHLR